MVSTIYRTSSSAILPPFVSFSKNDHLNEIPDHPAGTMLGVGNQDKRAAAIGHQRAKAHPLVISKPAR